MTPLLIDLLIQVSAGTIAPAEARVPSGQASHGGLLIDGSGLVEEPPGSGIFVHSSHRWADGGSMWVTGDHPPGLVEVWFDLGRSHAVDGLHVWNYNEKGYLGRGVKTFELMLSNDDREWTSAGTFALRKAFGGDDPGERVALPKAVEARYARLRILSTHGDPRWSGLSEVRFSAADADRSPRRLASRPPFKAKYPRIVRSPGPRKETPPPFPQDARVVDLTKPPYEAKGDGVTDDTAAIQRAFMDHVNEGAILYLPDGLYRVTDAIRWGHRLGRDGKIEEGSREKDTILHGQSRQGTVIRLDDRAKGFDSPRRPKPILWTGGDPAQRFGNEIAHLTVDSGAGNPGCAAVQFVANNQGSIHDVTIVSGDGQGVAGLDLAAANENGPLLVKRVEVVGFDAGIRAGSAFNSQTLEDVSLRDQNLVGLQNFGETLSVRRLSSLNDVTAVLSKSGVMTLLDSELKGRGEASARPAVEASGPFYARDVRTSGYAAALRPLSGGAEVKGPSIVEHAGKPFVGVSKAPRLEIRETPEVPVDPLSEWISPLEFGGKPDDDRDDTAAIQKAIDAGKPTVYFPRGRYRIRATVEIRGAVRRLLGLRPHFDVPRMDTPAFRVVDGSAPVVVIERITSGYAPTTTIEHASKRTLVLKHGLNVNVHATGGGDLFLEDVVSNPSQAWVFKGGRVWARQFNVEHEGTHVVNDGAALWILGYKTERGGTLVETRGGGVTELLGGFSYTTTKGSAAPMMVVDGGRLFAVFGEVCFTGDPFRIIVRDGSRELLKDDPGYGRALFYGSP